MIKVGGGGERLVQPAASVSVRLAAPPFRRRPAAATATATVRAAAADRPAGHGHHAPPCPPLSAGRAAHLSWLHERSQAASAAAAPRHRREGVGGGFWGGGLEAGR